MLPLARHGVLGAILLAAVATPASAQYGAQQPQPPAAAPRGEQEAPAAPAETAPEEVLRGVVCALGRDANAGNAVLATLPFSAEERTEATSFVRTAQRCLRLREPIATSVFSLRGVLAEALYESRFATPVAARAPALGATPLPRPGPGADAQIVAALGPMFALVDCATPREPGLIRALLATERRSAQETAALTALNPAFIACVPAGTQLSIDPRVMRNFFAEALYRWSVVQRDGPASPWARP